MMGMGEPLYNFDNVQDRARVVADGDGLALSNAAHHAFERRGADDRARSNEIGFLARHSLHAARDELRDVLVPLNKKYPIAEIDGGVPGIPRRFECASHHLRICDAQGRE